MLKIKNTLTKQLEAFTPINANEVSFYQCGPTVYSRQHVGNLRAATLGDFIRRSLMFLNYRVTYVRNITDVGHLVSDADNGEDKMAKGAKKEGTTPEEIAAKYTQIYREDLNQLNVIPPTHEPIATGYIQEMQEMIQTLIEKEYAYTTDKAVYFDVSKAAGYTRLSGQKLELNQQGAGHGQVDDLENKRNPQDFALWLFKTGEHANALQTWPSPFKSNEVEDGQGLPGWHIECSAMSKSLLGNHIDIHMGGVEHIAVHHTNEIAQSESANGEAFVNYWLHNEHLVLDNAKMSKSDGNVIFISDIAEKMPPLALRYFFLQSHYRSKQNLTWEALQAAARGLKRMQTLVTQIAYSLDTGYDPLPAGSDNKYMLKFQECLEDDFNLPQALATAWDLLQDNELANAVKFATITKFDQVLGLRLLDKVENPDSNSDIQVSTELAILLKERLQAREDKNWQKSDEIRDRIKEEFGYTVVDGENGQKLTNE